MNAGTATLYVAFIAGGSEEGIRQAEKFGHGGMADELRLALVDLGE